MKYTQTLLKYKNDTDFFEFENLDGTKFIESKYIVWGNWNTYKDSMCPPPPKQQKTSDTEQTTDNFGFVSIGTNKQSPFDYRLAKPRDGIGDVVLPFDHLEAKSATEGLFFETGNPGEFGDVQDDTTIGVPAIHNWYAVTTLSGAEQDKSLFVDTPGKRRWYESDDYIVNLGSIANYSKEPTTSSLIEYGQLDPKGRVPYYYSDFAYCKYWNKIPNNRLITLRRYAVPALASLDFPDYTPEPSKDASDNPKPMPGNNTFFPVAQAVTWFGSETENQISTLASFTVKLPWTELEAKVHDNTDNAQGADSMTGFMGGMFKSLSVLSGEATHAGRAWTGKTPPDPYQDGPYANRIKGPVNRIDKVKRRKEGLDFTHSLTLNFHYKARSIGGINTKAAMLDLIANFLLLTYGTGAFWGGANRFRGQSAAYPWKKGMAAWYAGKPGAFFDAIADSLSSAIDNISALFDNALSDPIGTLKNIASGAAGMAMLKQSGGAQVMHGMRALLTGEPVGEWHLVIGNPYNPIMTIGNLVCTSCTFKFSDELTPDDFPEEMTVTVTLEHGMPLDRSGVESMFNKGRGRIYTLPDGYEESFSAANETRVDANTGNRNPYLNKIMGVDSDGNGKRRTPIWVGNGQADYDAFINASSKTYNKGAAESTKLAKKIELGYSKSKNK